MTHFWKRRGKRWFDLSITLLILLLLWPLFLAVALMVRIMLGGPVLFTQRRLGQHAAEFHLYKFRSMTDARDAQGILLPDEQRLTRFGKWLRASSLDELPQTLNVLRGEMSLIGPRALLPEYRERLQARHPRRFDVLPGITGLAAVSGRNALPWETRLALDDEYVHRLSAGLDLYIFFKTIPVVLGRKGVSMPGMATVRRYDDDTADRPDSTDNAASSLDSLPTQAIATTHATGGTATAPNLDKGGQTVH
ncbi:sugar transferase [Pusillimonas sp. TS35]|uniref:sugar transferase n=1 Tax=Paracandidimonas lactea TaxID=2895524 RepID=UPI00136CE99D|nr:sugar transferase [Paracandidimonas lactea]MYN13574.1 sugar transferase [Pusillimonas sp. TS35]